MANDDAQMSSDDDFMMEDDFDYENEESDSDSGNIPLENSYYSAKGLKVEYPDEALKEFQSVLDKEVEKGDWGFKALKQMLKTSSKIGRFDQALKYYDQLLNYSLAVSKNYAEKSISNLLELIASCQNYEFLQDFYSKTLSSGVNERLMGKCNLKLAKVYLTKREYGKLSKLLKQLQQTCTLEDGSDDQKKGTTLLEIFALEIQMHTEMKNTKKLKKVYNQCLAVKSAIPHPRIMGIIRECGGKMYMSEKEWSLAQTDFFEAFKNYDEAGSHSRINTLKYLVLANMLMESDINPFDSQETKPFQNDPEILAMTRLVSAFQRKEIKEFEHILSENQSSIMGDPFIKVHIDQVLKNIRSQVLIKLIVPYTRIDLGFISQKLNISSQEVEDLLIGLILDKRVNARIDQVANILEIIKA